MAFFQSYHVHGGETEDQLNETIETEEDDDEDKLFRPKGNTACEYKSHLKMTIKELTEDHFDIANKSQFPKFNVSISIFYKKI